MKRTKAQQSPMPLDSRTAVARAIARAEREIAPIYTPTAARRRELQRIAATTPQHYLRLRKAMATDEVTAVEAVDYLDTCQPHARLRELRKAGVPVLWRWVSMRTATGGTRRVKAYRIVWDYSAST